MAEYVNLLDVLTEGRELPEGYDKWAIKSVHADFRTRHGYRWPFPGHVATCPEDKIVYDNKDSCPAQVGDGICVAKTWEGMVGGDIPAQTLLLVAYRNDEILGEDNNKVRVKASVVVDLIDGFRLIREKGGGANLHGTNLQGADLRDTIRDF